MIDLDNAKREFFKTFYVYNMKKKTPTGAEKEAWDLFLQTLGQVIDSIDLKEVEMNVPDGETTDFAIGIRDGYNSAVSDLNQQKLTLKQQLGIERKTRCTTAL